MRRCCQKAVIHTAGVEVAANDLAGIVDAVGIGDHRAWKVDCSVNPLAQQKTMRCSVILDEPPDDLIVVADGSHEGGGAVNGPGAATGLGVLQSGETALNQEEAVERVSIGHPNSRYVAACVDAVWGR